MLNSATTRFIDVSPGLSLIGWQVSLPGSETSQPKDRQGGERGWSRRSGDRPRADTVTHPPRPDSGRGADAAEPARQHQERGGGGGGVDSLRGHLGDDILLLGDDDLAGGDGRDILTGGYGADAPAGDDIVMAGPLDLTQAGLRAVAAEWSRTDRDYQRRVDAWRQGGGLNGSVVLTAPSIVRNDTSADTLTGGADRDWFWLNTAGPADLATDYDAQTEQVKLVVCLMNG
jgi:hypothetical protein